MKGGRVSSLIKREFLFDSLIIYLFLQTLNCCGQEKQVWSVFHSVPFEVSLLFNACPCPVSGATNSSHSLPMVLFSIDLVVHGIYFDGNN